MINNIIFKNIDLSLDELFADGQIFYLSNYINYIAADNGMGKTTIYNLLKDNFLRNYNNKIDLKILKELIFINSKLVLFDDIFIKNTLLFLQLKKFYN